MNFIPSFPCLINPAGIEKKYYETCYNRFIMKQYTQYNVGKIKF